MAARMYCLLAALAAMGLGYGSRAYAASLPVFVSDHFGDALWAAMIYFGVRFLWVRMSLPLAFGASLLFCWAVEFSQLYKADWIDRVRSTAPGSLMLGHGFLAVDLLRYAVGIAAACMAEAVVRKAGRGFGASSR